MKDIELERRANERTNNYFDKSCINEAMRDHKNMLEKYAIACNVREYTLEATMQNTDNVTFF